MLEDCLEQCPECEEGRMRPDSKVGSDGKIEEPFSETSSTRRYECDNCGYVEFRANTTENVRIGENLNISVEKADKK
jgi:C4-type Zn-finger protein